MSQSLSETVRRLVPRWRGSAVTARLGELRSHRRATHVRKTEHLDLDVELLRWKERPNLGRASELLGAALFAGRPAAASEAATFVLNSLDGAPAGARRIGEEILTRAERSSSRPEVVSATSVVSLGGEIRTNRELLALEPRNGIGWADLSLLYASLGLSAKAARSMDIALALAGENRFVLRSSARLWIHLDDPDRALAVLRATKSSQFDPWVMAAEMATAQTADRPIRSVRRVREILSGQRFSPRDTAELAGALATIEVESGARKVARKLFQQSLVDPTENAIAQASWATRQRGIDTAIVSARELGESSEALAMQRFQESSWAASVSAARSWLADERFSSRPAIHGSYTAAVALREFELAKLIAQQGLAANPTEGALLNNLAYAEANLGELDAADKTLQSVPASDKTGAQQICLEATRGLIEFRRGDAAAGRTYYQRALALARQFPDRRVYSQALLHLALEELRASGEGGRAIATAALDCEDKSSATLQLKQYVKDRLKELTR
jgi:tetratricopeptide (TPR) repeat protein